MISKFLCFVGYVLMTVGRYLDTEGGQKRSEIEEYIGWGKKLKR